MEQIGFGIPSGEVQPAIRAAIERNAAEVCEQRFGSGLRALILTGSVARNEATIESGSSPVRLLSDAEFICVCQNSVGLPSEPETAKIVRDIATKNSTDGISCPISLGIVHDRFLRKMRPHIFAYELRECGRVIAGEAQILSLIPEFTAKQIPLEDAWYLLCNRAVELLEHSGEITDRHRSELPGPLLYATVKMYIEMATSFLVFQGRYVPTYSGRAEQLRALAADMRLAQDCPLDLSAFARVVSECTSWKLGERRGPATAESAFLSNGFDLWLNAIHDIQALWRWELERMTASAANLPDRELMRLWMRRQPKAKRLRGWMLVLRQQGWTSSWRYWPRWFRLALRASPRYWIYAAACELLFELPTLVPGAGDGISPLLDFLPVVRNGGDDARDTNAGWRRTASEIGWNYQKFVMNTRS